MTKTRNALQKTLNLDPVLKTMKRFQELRLLTKVEGFIPSPPLPSPITQWELFNRFKYTYANIVVGRVVSFTAVKLAKLEWRYHCHWCNNWAKLVEDSHYPYSSDCRRYVVVCSIANQNVRVSRKFRTAATDCDKSLHFCLSRTVKILQLDKILVVHTIITTPGM